MFTVDLPALRSLCHIEVVAACPAILETGIPPADAAEGLANDHSSLSIYRSLMVHTLYGVSMAPTVVRRKTFRRVRAHLRILPRVFPETRNVGDGSRSIFYLLDHCQLVFITHFTSAPSWPNALPVVLGLQSPDGHT